MRLKLIVGNLVAVLVVGLASYFLVRPSIYSTLRSQVDSRITSDLQILERSVRLSGLELLSQVMTQAEQQPLRDAFAAIGEQQLRASSFERMESIKAWFGSPSQHGTPPNITLLTDDTGKVVARDTDRNRMFGQDLSGSVPAIARALRGEASTGVWSGFEQQKHLLVAAAPVRDPEGRVRGCLLVGYDFSNGVANAEAQRLGRSVAFLADGHVYGSSLDAASAADLNAAIGNVPTLNGSTPFSVSLAGRPFIGAGAAVPFAPALTMTVLGNYEMAISAIAPLQLILLFTLIGAGIVLAYAFVLAKVFLTPIEEIEEGLLAVINGKTDTRLEIESDELGGVAYRFNQLLNLFTGTPEGDEPISSGKWDEVQGSAQSLPQQTAVSDGDGTIDDPAVAATLAAEPEQSYHERVFKEYAAGKQANGEAVSVPMEKFIQRLSANAASLAKKHGCKSVRFQVQVRGTQVNLVPVLIR